ncbi:hypothetical protein COCNU_01G010710 [Cocos nucifera]|uniref:Uncharacterized protein n=1 Tax=Cocos nucifera TaxID=13894 RepID=A0A8K0HUY4_COCNU|nr:hypothetical protein COCNU_01G010710 [Cocos nucifera]
MLVGNICIGTVKVLKQAEITGLRSTQKTEHTSAHESENFQINTDTFFGKNKPSFSSSMAFNGDARALDLHGCRTKVFSKVILNGLNPPSSLDLHGCRTKVFSKVILNGLNPPSSQN